MKQYGHLNPSEETGTGCPITSKYGRTPPNKHGGVGRQQQHIIYLMRGGNSVDMIIQVRSLEYCCFVKGAAWLTHTIGVDKYC